LLVNGKKEEEARSEKSDLTKTQNGEKRGDGKFLAWGLISESWESTPRTSLYMTLKKKKRRRGEKKNGQTFSPCGTKPEILQQQGKGLKKKGVVNINALTKD